MANNMQPFNTDVYFYWSQLFEIWLVVAVTEEAEVFLKSLLNDSKPRLLLREKFDEVYNLLLNNQFTVTVEGKE